MTTITKSNTISEKLEAEYTSSKGTLFGDAKLRDVAMETFLKQGIPSRKQEEYRYLNIDVLLKDNFGLSIGKAISTNSLKQRKGIENSFLVVIENGSFNAELSLIRDLPKGLIISDIAKASSSETFQKHFSKQADIQNDPFIALNTALANGGVFVHVAKSAVIEHPIHILNICSVDQNTFIQSRNLIVAEENSQAKFVEHFVTMDSSAKSFSNAITEIVVAANANIEHYKIQEEGENGHLMNTTQVYQEKQSVFSTNNFTLSGSFVRNNLNIILDAEYIETHLNGLYITGGTQVIDNHTLVDHRKPNCNSNELYKGIIEDKSSATFNGKIYVRKDAQKTNAFQSNKNILLSDDGTINTKPQLEIYADDVKCSHGTSTGKLDEDKVFYLRTRGLSELNAKKLLMHAFASEVVDQIRIDSLRDYVEEMISSRFE